LRKGSTKNLEQPDVLTAAGGGSSFSKRPAMILGPVGLFAIIVLYFVLDQSVTTDETTSTFSAEKSIAVLPFADLSPEGDQEYLSDGISEGILNLLTKVPDIRVTSRMSAFSFKGQNLDLATMAARLNVTYILEGSVRKFGNQLRITAHLTEVAADRAIWSKPYDRKLQDVFAIQDEIAAAVVDALKITLLGKELKATETNPEAYGLYLQARYFLNQFTEEGHKGAETLLRQALDIDPGFAPAWTELGRVYAEQATTFSSGRNDEAHELALDALQKALDIDPQDGRALAVLGDFKIHYDWDLTAAFQNIQQALALNPGDSYILHVAAHLEGILGRTDEAIDLHRRSIAVDPVWSEAHLYLGLAYYHSHRLEEAADALQMALSLSPGGIFPQYVLGKVLLAQGDAPAALVAMEQETSDLFRVAGRAIVQHALGDARASDAALQEMIETWGALEATHIAQVYSFRGEVDNAFDWLDQAYDSRDGGLIFLLLQPLFANLHDDPRWEPLLDKIGLPH
jgi:TolB-like protein/Tfp pilus assembly protein PilF